MTPEQIRIATEIQINYPRIRFGVLADKLLQRPEFAGMNRDDLLIELARQAWRLDIA